MIDRIGQLFITGYEGETPSEDYLAFLERQNPGGIILFEENCNPHSRAESSLQKISARTNVPPFIAVDQEGGRVCRFRGVPAEYGAPSDYAEHDKIDLYAEHFSRSAYYLRSLGINLLLGPVADLNLNRDNQCLQGRTFGSQSSRVIPFIERTIKIAHKAGLLTCTKHFPGLGAAKLDPHEELVSADYTYQTFLNRESFTFQAAVRSGSDMIMTTHLLLPSLDNYPATISQVVVEKLLRETLAFDGIVITDDLLMKGADRFGNHGERAFKAFHAGHDILLFGRNYRAADEAIQYFKQAYRKGLLDSDRLRSSLNRISGIKSKLTASVV